MFENIKPRVLIAEDERHVRYLFKKILGNNGYKVVAAVANGKEAVAQYKELKPDLVLMDMMMPEMSGIEAIKQIISFDVKAKIIMITVMTDRQKAEEAIRSGACDYIVKPFIEERVLAGIERVLKD